MDTLTLWCVKIQVYAPLQALSSVQNTTTGQLKCRLKKTKLLAYSYSYYTNYTIAQTLRKANS
jgi:hypothetical protein